MGAGTKSEMLSEPTPSKLKPRQPKQGKAAGRTLVIFIRGLLATSSLYSLMQEIPLNGLIFAVDGAGQEQKIPEQAVVIQRVTLLPGNDSECDRLLIRADRFFEPLVFGMEGANPYGERNRIVLDITGVFALPFHIDPVIQKGRLVRDIRHHFYRGESRLRLVLDLAPAEGYEVTQRFYEEQNLYSLSIMEIKHTQSR
jgi:hypothetical protein